jgi:methionyl-tRNA synthetase
LISEANKLIVEAKPWELAKSASREDRAKLEATLFRAAEHLRIGSVLLYLVIPSSACRVWKLLGQQTPLESERIDVTLGSRRLRAGDAIGSPEPIFPRLDKEKTLAKLDELAEADREPKAGSLREAPLQTEGGRLKEMKSMDSDSTKGLSPESLAPGPGVPAPSAEAPKISIEDFAKVEMRVGEIKSAEPVAGAQKLMKLTVDIGSEVRQVVAGIAEHYTPEQLVGMKVVIVTNLQPRKLRGVESNGMIVAASAGPNGRPVLVTFKEDVEVGARLK